MKKILIILFLLLFLYGCVEKPAYTNSALYECKEGSYSFPENEPVFKNVELFLIDFEGLKDNECMLSLEYKIKIKPTDNPYFEIDFDTCKLTMSQLAYFKEKNADLMTILKDATCDQKTNQFLEKATKPSDFKGQVKEIIGNFGTSTTEFTAIVEDWLNGIVTFEEVQQAIKDEKITASKAFKDLKDLQPQPEEQEIQTQAVKAVELYLDSLNSFEESLNKQSQEDYQSSMERSTSQMDEAIKELSELNKLLE